MSSSALCNERFELNQVILAANHATKYYSRSASNIVVCLKSKLESLCAVKFHCQGLKAWARGRQA
eukprot:scaffold571359_cov18-Prasinocladus_malaysianus.AAC.1